MRPSRRAPSYTRMGVAAMALQPEEVAAALADPALIARWRRELADLSTFHKFLKQRIARIINLEDDVTGQSNGCGHYGSPDQASQRVAASSTTCRRTCLS